MQNDAISELIHRILEATNREGSLTESLALEVERTFRRDYSGETVYVKREVDSSVKKTQAVSAYLEGKPIQQITHHHGISRATLYRHLKKQS